jgi:hypothetical protein
MSAKRVKPGGTLIACSTHAPAEEFALDILHDAGAQHVTRATVEHHLRRLAAHRSGRACPACEAAAKADLDWVYRCLRDWRRATPT